MFFKVLPLLAVTVFLFYCHVSCDDDPAKEMVAGTDKLLGQAEQKAEGGDCCQGGDDKKDNENKDKGQEDKEKSDKEKSDKEKQDKEKQENEKKEKDIGGGPPNEGEVPPPDGYMTLIPPEQTNTNPNTRLGNEPPFLNEPVDTTLGRAGTGYMEFYDKYPELDPYHYREKQNNPSNSNSLAVMPPNPMLFNP